MSSPSFKTYNLFFALYICDNSVFVLFITSVLNGLYALKEDILSSFARQLIALRIRVAVEQNTTQ